VDDASAITTSPAIAQVTISDTAIEYLSPPFTRHGVSHISSTTPAITYPTPYAGAPAIVRITFKMDYPMEIGDKIRVTLPYGYYGPYLKNNIMIAHSICGSPIPKFLVGFGGARRYRIHLSPYLLISLSHYLLQVLV